MKRYYTIFIGDKIWQNCIDDMNTTEIWSTGGMIWNSKKKAVACMKNLKRYDFEDIEGGKFTIRELFIKP